MYSNYLMYLNSHSDSVMCLYFQFDLFLLNLSYHSYLNYRLLDQLNGHRQHYFPVENYSQLHIFQKKHHHLNQKLIWLVQHYCALS
ncbi:hypothetical protein NIAS840_00002 [Ligilactobacillus salivarius NIAS840]|uniref:Uncharacterized protein n=1 Tax=Ligilactobacillus salivarius NIAS840 TaxID=1029822 RepID=F5VF62_9LACO|nr:hypothetical protein NIAS840_00002 [Ligilactobacillus salivarius NIAS840]